MWEKDLLITEASTFQILMSAFKLHLSQIHLMPKSKAYQRDPRVVTLIKLGKVPPRLFNLALQISEPRLKTKISIFSSLPRRELSYQCHFIVIPLRFRKSLQFTRIIVDYEKGIQGPEPKTIARLRAELQQLRTPPYY